MRKIFMNTANIGGGFLLGVALVAALWTASTRWVTGNETLTLIGGAYLMPLWVALVALVTFGWFKLGQKWGPLWIISATALLLALLDNPALIYKAPAEVAVIGVLLALLGLKQYGMGRALQTLALLLARNAKAGTGKAKERMSGDWDDFK